MDGCSINVPTLRLILPKSLWHMRVTCSLGRPQFSRPKYFYSSSLPKCCIQPQRWQFSQVTIICSHYLGWIGLLCKLWLGTIGANYDQVEIGNIGSTRPFSKIRSRCGYPKCLFDGMVWCMTKNEAFFCMKQSNLDLEKVNIVHIPFIDLCQISARNRGEWQWRIVSVLMLNQVEQDPLGAGVTNKQLTMVERWQSLHRKVDLSRFSTCKLPALLSNLLYHH